MLLDGVCCALCAKFETKSCPVRGASPWSKWQDWCNEYEPHPNVSGAKTIKSAIQEKHEDKEFRPRGFIALPCGENTVIVRASSINFVYRQSDMTVVCCPSRESAFYTSLPIEDVLDLIEAEHGN